MTEDLKHIQEKLNLETAKIAWKELQTFFASGSVIEINQALDLLEVAECLARNDTETLAQWIEDKMIAAVSDELARQWFEEDAELWAVVIRPWILVQYPL